MEMEGDDFCEAFLGFLLNLAAAKDKAVRFRVCQIVAGVLNALAVDAEISDELYERMEDVMLERLRDKMPLVRAQAARRVLSHAGPRTTASAS
jgi:condensin complex subunit 3